MLKQKKNAVHLHTKADFKLFSREVKRLKLKLKARYYAGLLNKLDPRASWRVVSEILCMGNGKENTNRHIDRIVLNNIEYTDSSQIANVLNRYYVEAAKNLAQDMPHVSVSVSLSDPVTSSFFLGSVDASEISTIVGKLKLSKGPDNDCCDCKALEECRAVLSPTVANLINSLFVCCAFLDPSKTAMFILIENSGDKSNPSNYRPISLLPALSKIFEIAFRNRLLDYLTSSKLLCKCQYGYVTNSNTQATAANVIATIQSVLDKNKITAAVFIDLSKAFDIVDHNILLTECDRIGIRCTPLL